MLTHVMKAPSNTPRNSKPRARRASGMVATASNGQRFKANSGRVISQDRRRMVLHGWRRVWAL